MIMALTLTAMLLTGTLKLMMKVTSMPIRMAMSMQKFQAVTIVK